jgi:hypothetical protein
VEARYGGHFAEITHEFLIQPILIEIQERVTGDVEESQFRIALETVTRFRNRDIRSREEAQISGRDFASLVRNWSRISWTDWASELMLRNAILHGVDRETFLLIAGTFEKNTEPFDVAKLRESIPSRRVRRWYLDLFELQALRHDGSPEDLEPHEVAFALESALSCTLGRPWDEVRFWTQEHSRSHGTNHAVRD